MRQLAQNLVTTDAVEEPSTPLQGERSHGDRSAAAVAVAAEVLGKSGRLRLRVHGESMLPTLWPHDLVEISRCSLEDVGEGEIVLATRDGRFFLHRFVSRCQPSGFLLRGDSMPAPDPLYGDEAFLGRLTNSGKLKNRGGRSWPEQKRSGQSVVESKLVERKLGEPRLGRDAILRLRPWSWAIGQLLCYCGPARRLALKLHAISTQWRENEERGEETSITGVFDPATLMPTTRQMACIEIGRIPVSLSTKHRIFFDLLQERYRGFLSTSTAEFALEFEIVEGGSVTDEDIQVRREGAEWRIERGDFCARWDARSGRGSVRQNANPYSLDSVLRILHSLILVERGGFLLHAASAICDGQAFLFSGVSGAGKTTMTRLAPAEVTLLTDEISYIRPDKFGYSAFGTPFAGELARPGENTSAPISALFFLEKGPENRMEPMEPAEAVRRLMRNILFFAEDPKLVEKLLVIACNFISHVPIRRLTFYPDQTVWDEVRRFARGRWGRGGIAHACLRHT